jgi:hypothetical protein
MSSPICQCGDCEAIDDGVDDGPLIVVAILFASLASGAAGFAAGVLFMLAKHLP